MESEGSNSSVTLGENGEFNLANELAPDFCVLAEAAFGTDA